ncbi:MAG: hypothetical protein ACWGQW_11810, partial [bacterium]
MAETGCPRCGRRPGEKQTSSQSDRISADSQPPIQFDVMVSSETVSNRNQLDWKEELKKKLEQRMGDSKEDTGEVEGIPTDQAPEEDAAETPPTLFKYKLDRALRNASPPSKVENR